MARKRKTVTPTRGPLAGQTFPSKQAYRTALAQLDGFRSDYARRQVLQVRKQRQAVEQLPPERRRARQRALEAVNIMCSKGSSLEAAASRAGTTPKTVKRYAKGALEKRKGTYRPKKVDRALRSMTLLTPKGNKSIWVRTSRDASRIGRYNAAIRTYLEVGDYSRVEPFIGQSITDAYGDTWDFITDKTLLKKLGNAGVLSFESIYADAA